MATQGNTTVDFGSAGAVDAKAVVIGQAGFTTGTNQVEAWIDGRASANNTADNHAYEDWEPVIVSSQITGTGFTIIVRVGSGRAFGIYNVSWVWN